MTEKAWKGGESLAALRQSLGLTQEELAELLGYSRALVAAWESGRRKPDVVALEKLAEFFGIDLNDLLEGKPVKPRRFPPGLIGIKVHLRADGVDEDVVRHILWIYQRWPQERRQRASDGARQAHAVSAVV